MVRGITPVGISVTEAAFFVKLNVGFSFSARDMVRRAGPTT